MRMMCFTATAGNRRHQHAGGPLAVLYSSLILVSLLGECLSFNANPLYIFRPHPAAASACATASLAGSLEGGPMRADPPRMLLRCSAMDCAGKRPQQQQQQQQGKASAVDPPPRMAEYLKTVGIEASFFEAGGDGSAQGAAGILGAEPGSVIKSLLFLAGGRPVLVLAPGDQRVNTERLTRLMGASKEQKSASLLPLLAAPLCPLITLFHISRHAPVCPPTKPILTRTGDACDA